VPQTAYAESLPTPGSERGNHLLGANRTLIVEAIDRDALLFLREPDS